MKKMIQTLFLITFGVFCYIGASYAADVGSINILSPKDGAVVKAGSPTKLTYNVKLGPGGNHLHVYVDDQQPIVDRDVSGCPCTIDLPALPVGKHAIAIKEARADHSLTGVQTAISVSAK